MFLLRRGRLELSPKHFLPPNKGEWREAPRGFNSIIPLLSPKCRLKDKLNLPRRWRGDPSVTSEGIWATTWPDPGLNLRHTEPWSATTGSEFDVDTQNGFYEMVVMRQNLRPGYSVSR
jgi:hypothetical protein